MNEQDVMLLPCPLADKGNAVFTENGFFFGIGYGVKCDDCGLWLDSRARTKEAAAALWNTRDSMTDKEQQEHPYFIHARECQTCGPEGFCAEGLRLYTGTQSTTCSEDSSHAKGVEVNYE